MQPLNPYTVGKAVGGGPAFVGRDDILQEIYRLLPHPQQNAILLYGQHQIGKTSILREIEDKLNNEANYCTIFFDLLGKDQQSIEPIVQQLANLISDKLGMEKPQLSAEPKTYFRNTWLPDLISTRKDTSIVLLFDEFNMLEDLSKPTRTNFFSYLLDLLAIERERLNFVFASCEHSMNDLIDITTTNLFEGISLRPVSLLTREDTLKLIRLSGDYLQWSTEAEETVWQLTRGHPHQIQQVCHNVWKYLYNGQNVTERPIVHSVHIAVALRKN